jgi:serine/threonine-protein kinase
VPVALDAVIATGMAKAPEQRYATSVQLAHAAHDAITTPIPAATPTMQPGPLTRQAPEWSAVSSAPGEMPPPRSGAAHDSAPRPSWRRNQVMIPIAVVLAVVVGAAVVLVVTVNSNRGPAESAPAAQLSTTPTTTTTTTTTTTSNTAASACADFKFNGGFALDQSNRYRVDFTSTGQAASGRATATNGSNTLAGNVSGGVTGSHVNFTIQWDSGPRGRYTGEIDPDGFARGTNFDEANPGITGTWNSTTPFACAKPR